MKNALFWLLVLVVAVILALIGYGIYLTVANASSGVDLAAAVCTGIVVVVALIAWEVLMKPGYYRREREGDEPPGEEAGGEPGVPPSR